MTFKYDITDAEFAEYAKNVYKTTLNFKGNIWKYIAFIVVIIGINIFTSMSRVGSTDNPSSYITPLISWLTFIAILVGVWFIITKVMSEISANTTQSKLKTSIYGLICVGAFLAYLYFSTQRSMQNGVRNPPSTTNTLLSWIFLAGLIGASWTLIFNHLSSVKRLKPEDRETLLGEREMTFDNDRLTTKNKHTESIFRWEAIKKWEQTTNLYLLFITDNSAFIVPKRVFENEEQEAAFVQLLQRKLPNLTSEKYLDA